MYMFFLFATPQKTLQLEMQTKTCHIVFFFFSQLTFKRPSNDRNLSFEMIAKEAQLPLEEVSNKTTNYKQVCTW